MKAIRDMTVGELAAMVSSHLKGRGVNVVLSGGTCVTLYSDGRYVSYDLDFIRVDGTSRRQLVLALADLGFEEKGRVFRHPDTVYLLDFPAPPLAVGEEPVKATQHMEFSTGSLELLSATDCVKDRLAAYYHFHDQQALEQALLVGEAQRVDIEEVRRWSRVEGKLAEFNRFRERLNPPDRPGGPLHD